MTGRLASSWEDAMAASAIPGAVDAELASRSVTSKRLAHFGHFIFLPAATRSGKFKITPHFWHKMVRGMVLVASGLSCLFPTYYRIWRPIPEIADWL